MKRLPFLFLGLVVACTSTGATTTTTTASPSTTAPTISATTTSPITTPTTAPGGDGCGSEMAEAGLLATPAPAASDAEQLAAITWDPDPQCERFTIEFTSAEGAPSTASPLVEANFMREAAVLRVFLDVEVTVLTDQLVQSGLVDRLYVVRQSDRRLFVDFHLSTPALAAVGVSASPGNIEILFEPGGPAYEGAASFADNVVVVLPSPGPVVVPIDISGYSRNFEANTVVQVTRDGTVVAEDFTTAADWSETWGEFGIAVSPEGSGPAELFVGEFSAQDGSPRGLILNIEY